ncbi:hypothetical protein TRFO_03476 [Tritrichomonas foetus]|uniref:Uncharacterized protein n=1 Tax=Tritrichomonas foetus TaxID=1144522 RepID=A0A1J4KP38_9EUKA|nr:hypothetical protein TRFO_03476 [Tritrichomonas foetus]|eukprot:OHT13055.1 hypothetical protein TRFO_03476 [Tritrichomonas foetus]
MNHCMSRKFFSNSEWFPRIFGFTETIIDVDTYIDFQENLLHSYKNHSTFSAGTFNEKTMESFPSFQNRNGGTFSIIKNMNLADPLISYSIPDNCGATFQVNSHFNCLEFISPNQDAERGVSCYIYNNTSGSRASIATAPSLLFRNYFLTTQTGNEIQLLSNVPIPIKHGFSMINETNFVNEISFDWSNLNYYKVGVHENCQVVLKKHDDRNLSLNTSNQIVHQVFASSLDFSNPCFNTKLSEKIEGYLLEAEYKATIMAAWDNSLKYSNYPGSKNCFLVALGADLFKAPLHIINKAILSCQELIASSGLNVALLAPENHVFLSAVNTLGDMVAESNGQILT